MDEGLPGVPRAGVPLVELDPLLPPIEPLVPGEPPIEPLVLEGLEPPPMEPELPAALPPADPPLAPPAPPPPPWAKAGDAPARASAAARVRPFLTYLNMWFS